MSGMIGGLIVRLKRLGFEQDAANRLVCKYLSIGNIDVLTALIREWEDDNARPL
jgi:hypothetical protein